MTTSTTSRRALTTVLAVAALVLLVLGTAAPVQAVRPASSGSATLSGGHYVLTGLEPGALQDSTWQVSGAARGGSYRLLSTSPSAASGSGCCCTFVPCLLRGSQP